MQPRWTECNPDASDIVVAHGLLRQQVEENLDVDGAVERQDGDKVLVDTVRRLAPLLCRRGNSVRQIELLTMHSSNGRNDSDDHDGAMTASQRSQHEATEATATDDESGPHLVRGFKLFLDRSDLGHKLLKHRLLFLTELRAATCNQPSALCQLATPAWGQK